MCVWEGGGGGSIIKYCTHEGYPSRKPLKEIPLQYNLFTHLKSIVIPWSALSLLHASHDRALLWWSCVHQDRMCECVGRGRGGGWVHYKTLYWQGSMCMHIIHYGLSFKESPNTNCLRIMGDEIDSNSLIMLLHTDTLLLWRSCVYQGSDDR